VHLGQDDLPLTEARALLGPQAFLGQSTHSLEQALAAEAAGADYIGVGPIFTTPTKPDYGSVGVALIPQVAVRIRIPFVCIGGIEAGTVSQILEAGGRCVAVVRAVTGAPDPESAARELKRRLTQFPATTV
jgi:thiamine-phosphate pyrophosphorylase